MMGETISVQELDRERLEIDRKRVSLDGERVALEREKLRSDEQKTKWTILSVAVPLLAAVATLAYNIWTTHEQEKNGFQLEAAKAVMQSGSPGEALDKTKLLVGMFPDRLPKNFMHEVDISSLFDKYDAAAKIEFFKAMAARNLSASDLVELWQVLFADDSWPKTPEMAAFLGKVDHHQSP